MKRMISNVRLIDKKEITLSVDELEAEEKFHRSRIPFAWINGKLEFLLDPEDLRDHHHWLTEDFNIKDCTFERVPRGYMMRERVQLFIGSNFDCIYGDFKISLTEIELIKYVYRSIFPVAPLSMVPVYNGVIRGKIGEIWPPKELIMILNMG